MESYSAEIGGLHLRVRQTDSGWESYIASPDIAPNADTAKKQAEALGYRLTDSDMSTIEWSRETPPEITDRNVQRYRLLRDYLLRHGIVRHVNLTSFQGKPFVMGANFYGEIFEDAVDTLNEATNYQQAHS